MTIKISVNLSINRNVGIHEKTIRSLQKHTDTLFNLRLSHNKRVGNSQRRQHETNKKCKSWGRKFESNVCWQYLFLYATGQHQKIKFMEKWPKRADFISRCNSLLTLFQGGYFMYIGRGVQNYPKSSNKGDKLISHENLPKYITTIRSLR